MRSGEGTCIEIAGCYRRYHAPVSRTINLGTPPAEFIEAGMTFHFMTGLWLVDWGLVTTESIVITDGAPECLANVERKLFVKS